MRLILAIKRKYDVLSVPAKASLWFVVCNVIQKGISLLTTPVFTRLLSAEEYGVYSVYQSWYSIICIFATLNLYGGFFINTLTNAPEKKSSTSALLGLTTLCTISLAIIYAVAPSFWNNLLDLSTPLVTAIFAQSISIAAYNFWMVEQRYHYKYKLFLFTTIGMAFFSSILGIWTVMLTNKYKVEARVWSFIAVHGILAIISYIHIMWKGKKPIEIHLWKSALVFSLPLIPHYLSQIVLSQSDRIMIKNLIGNGEAGFYSVSYSISMLMMIVIDAIGSTITFYTYQSIKGKNTDGIRMVCKGCVILVGGGCFLTMLLAPEIVYLFAPEQYYDAISIIPSVSASVFFIFLTKIYGNVEFYYEKTKFVMIATSAAAVLNIVLNRIFIPVFGYWAAGYTTLISYLLYTVMHGFFCRKICQEKLNMPSLFDEKLFMGLSIIMILLAVLTGLVYNYLFLRLLLLILSLILVFVKRKYFKDFMKLLKK